MQKVNKLAVLGVIIVAGCATQDKEKSRGEGISNNQQCVIYEAFEPVRIGMKHSELCSLISTKKQVLQIGWEWCDSIIAELSGKEIVVFFDGPGDGVLSKEERIISMLSYDQKFKAGQLYVGMSLDELMNLKGAQKYRLMKRPGGKRAIEYDDGTLFIISSNAEQLTCSDSKVVGIGLYDRDFTKLDSSSTSFSDNVPIAEIEKWLEKGTEVGGGKEGHPGGEPKNKGRNE